MGVIQGIGQGTSIGVIKGDTRSVGYGSYVIGIRGRLPPATTDLLARSPRACYWGDVRLCRDVDVKVL